MTNTIKTHYVVCLLLAFMAIGVSTAAASEVTGTLSSDATAKQTPTGDVSGTVIGDIDEGELSGTVTSESSDGSLTGTVQSESSRGGSSSGTRTSGGRVSGNGTATSDAPQGAVLGTTNDSLAAPNFPNAGVATATTTSAPTLWSKLMTFLGNLIS